MPSKSPYSYKQIKDICYKEIKKYIDTPVLFRQLQYQTMTIHFKSGINVKTILDLLNALNTKWHFIAISDDNYFNLLKNEKENAGRKDNDKSSR